MFFFPNTLFDTTVNLYTIVVQVNNCQISRHFNTAQHSVSLPSNQIFIMTKTGKPDNVFMFPNGKLEATKIKEALPKI